MEFMGKSVFGGIAIGKVLVYDAADTFGLAANLNEKKGRKKLTEYERFCEAVDIAKKQLTNVYEKACQEVGEAEAAIFGGYLVMMDDVEFIKLVANMINVQGKDAVTAVKTAAAAFSERFSNMQDEYMRSRALDVRDISQRVIDILEGKQSYGKEINEPVIVVAEELTPSETILMDKSKVLAFVTRFGSTNSHVAILAKTLGIPTLVGVDFSDEIDGKMGVVDALGGKLIVTNDEDELKEYRIRKEEYEAEAKALVELKGLENITSDGRRIEILANIGNVSDVDAVISSDAAGIGLFRSEFLYLEHDSYPTEEEQFSAYKCVVEKMEGKPVVIRTLDIGEDKLAPYMKLKSDENTSAIYRGIRVSLENDDIFKTQLRAIFRASAFGSVSVLIPMVTVCSEVEFVKKTIEEVKAELTEEKVEFGEIRLGAMIETPAAVMISDELGRMVDFFSIGTNDLTQYTFGVDRQKGSSDEVYSSHQPIILDMIRKTVENGHNAGCKVEICGEMAADISLTSEFIDMGVDALSVAPSMVLKVRKAVRSL